MLKSVLWNAQRLLNRSISGIPSVGIPKDAGVAHQTDGAARGESAAAKPEEEQFITGLVVADQEPVGVTDIARQPNTESSTSDPLSPVRADPSVVEHALLGAV